MREIRFTFDGEHIHDGFTDGSTWNGFANVWVTAETHRKVLEYIHPEGGFDEIEPDENGLYPYAGGFTATLVDDK